MKIDPVQENPSNFKNQLATFEKSIEFFKRNQEKLLEENPFVEIIDNSTYELAKKSRTALLKGRTRLQEQEKQIKKVVNNIKSYTVDSIKELIDITHPSEQKQQDEVKKYEAEKEEKRRKKQQEEEEKKQIAISKIDKIFKDIDNRIDSMVYDGIEEVEKHLILIAETNVNDDLGLFYDSKLKISQNNFVSKVNKLENEKKETEAKQKNKLKELENTWIIKILEANADNIKEVNTEFKKCFDSFKPTDFTPYDSEYIGMLADLIIRIDNKELSLKEDIKAKEEEEKKKAEEEASRLADLAIRDTISKKYNEAKKSIEDLPLYGYKETIQKVEENIMLLKAEANNIEYSVDVEERVEFLNTSLKLRIFEIKKEIKKQEEEKEKEAKRKKEEEEKAAAASKKTEQEQIEFEKATQVDYVDLIELVKYLNFEKSQIPEFETEEGQKAFKKIRQILTESKDDMNIIINKIMKR